MRNAPVSSGRMYGPLFPMLLLAAFLFALVPPVALCAKAYGAPSAYSIVPCFDFDMDGGSLECGPALSGRHYVEFAERFSDGRAGSHYLVRIQVSDGRVDAFERTEEASLKAYWNVMKNLEAEAATDDVRLLSSIQREPPLRFASMPGVGGGPVAAVTTEFALCLFEGGARGKDGAAAVFKYYLDERPLAMWRDSGMIFVLTAKSFRGFRIAGGVYGPSKKSGPPSALGLDAAAMLGAPGTVSSDTTPEGFEMRRLVARPFMFGGVRAVSVDPKSRSFKAYFIGGMGDGHRNIFSVDENFSVSRVCGFSGEITDFEALSPRGDEFLIRHRRQAGRRAVTWKLVPPDSLSKPPAALADAVFGGGGTGEVASAFSRADGSVTTVELISTGEISLFSLERSGSPAATFEVFVGSGRRGPGLFALCAILPDAERPLFAYYDELKSRIVVVDAAAGKPYDYVYLNPERGRVAEMKFCQDGGALLIKTEYYDRKKLGAGVRDVAMSALYIYRPRNRYLAQACSFRTIDSFDFFKFGHEEKLLVVFGEGKEPDSLGLISLN